MNDESPCLFCVAARCALHQAIPEPEEVEVYLGDIPTTKSTKIEITPTGSVYFDDILQACLAHCKTGYNPKCKACNP